MPGQFNTGRDVSINLNGAGGVVSFSIVTDFSVKQRSKQLDSAGIDGVTRFEEIPDGWEGTIEIDRASRTLDDFIDLYEKQYYNGQTITLGTITQTVQEIDGTASQWQYTRVRFKLDDGGSWKKDSKVNQKASWVASFRNKLA